LIYDLLKAIHVISFVFMSIPLFNLIVASERGHFGSDFNYSVDNYMENILRGGAIRCFVFQASVGITGLQPFYTAADRLTSYISSSFFENGVH